MVQRVLQWIAYATPKLTTNELTEIVAIGEDARSLNPGDCPDSHDLLRACGSLLRQAEGSIELAHFTVLEFLERIDPDDESIGIFRLEPSNSLVLAKTCAAYLRCSSFSQPPSIFHKGATDYAFHDYACQNFLAYLRMHPENDDLIEQLKELFGPQKVYNLTNFILRHLELPQDRGKQLEPRQKDAWMDSICSHDFGNLHAAAMLHLSKICHWLIAEGADVDAKSQLGVPLECAVYGTSYALRELDGNVETLPHLFDSRAQDTIRVLLDAKAECNPESVHNTSLSYAVILGPIEIFAMMLSHGMLPHVDAAKHVGFQDFDQRAVSRPNFMKMLVHSARNHQSHTFTKASQKLAMTDDVFFETLSYCVKFGPVATLRDLVYDERFVKDMRLPEGSGTLLHLATNHEHSGSLGFLLERGFDPALLDNGGRTVLHRAISARICSMSITRMLIERDIAGILDEDGHTAWHIAAALGHEHVLEQLIAHYGAEDTAMSKPSLKGYSPLLEAIMNKQERCASLLLDAFPSGAIQLRDWRLIHCALALGANKVIRELLDRGANPCLVSERKQTALFFITAATTLEICKTLCSKGLCVNHVDSMGKTPLSAMLECDQQDVEMSWVYPSYVPSRQLDSRIIYLLATPFSASFVDHENKTPWYYFCCNTLPMILASVSSAGNEVYLMHLYVALRRNGGMQAYDEANSASSIGLLVHESLRSSKALRKTKMEWLEDESSTLGKFLLGVINTLSVKELAMTRSVMVRLLIWSLLVSERSLFERLLELGVDAHAVCMYHGNRSAVDIAIQQDVDVNLLYRLLAFADISRLIEFDARGWPRHFALCASSTMVRSVPAVVKLKAILKSSVDPNARSDHLHTAAMVAASTGSLDVLKLLVAYRADLHLANDSGWTVVHYAVSRGHIPVLEFLREHLKDSQYWTQLVPCSLRTLTSRVSSKSSLSIKTYSDCTLVHLAAYSQSSETLRFLDANTLVHDIEAKTKDGVTPIQFAACARCPASIRWFLNKDVSVRQLSTMSKRKALRCALRLGNFESAVALIEHGAEITPDCKVHPRIRAELLKLIASSGLQAPSTFVEALSQSHESSAH
jgi:ankyrin repeat protein